VRDDDVTPESMILMASKPTNWGIASHFNFMALLA